MRISPVSAAVVVLWGTAGLAGCVGRARGVPSSPRGSPSADFLPPLPFPPQKLAVREPTRRRFLRLSNAGRPLPFHFQLPLPPRPQNLPQASGTGRAPAMEPSAREPLVRKPSSSYRTFPEGISKRLDKEYLR